MRFTPVRFAPVRSASARVVLLILVLLGLAVIAACNVTSPQNVLCTDAGSGSDMTLYEAQDIAGRSDCMREGSIKPNGVCNEQSGTWWLGFTPKEPRAGCNPACVIDITTGQAELNWRCTGLETP